ncbi:hypothetical protein NEFER03_0742 [Nematocida sp. LUAm3]|nr:hypothetical protein NEFER03_0742 [Nematocida sp. LUAm3]KAI5175201.1 hypothetical protein NEFER02_1162 [Nematocida sp. LUAm2]KAI5178127.1 hypothetical protein NEFER01_1305 [Nematocida sp. LUAm1]
MLLFIEKTREFSMYILIFLLGTISAIVSDSSMKDISQSDVYSVICLFMLLSLTFSISFYGIKKLIEASPKQAILSGISPPRPTKSYPQQSPHALQPSHALYAPTHEVIDF